MKTVLSFKGRTIAIVVSAIILAAFSVIASVRAATTIGTNISTAGTLTVGTDPTVPNAYFTGKVLIGTTTPDFPVLDIAVDGASYIRTTAYRTHQQGGGLYIQHARGTIASPVQSSVGDVAGTISWQIMDSTLTFQELGQIRLQGANNSLLYGNMQFAVNNTFDRAMSIEGGNDTGGPNKKIAVGIGGTAATLPGYSLDVGDNVTGQKISSRVLNVGTANLAMFDTSDSALASYGGYFSVVSSKTGANPLTNVGLYAEAANATFNYAAIFGAGNVGIGTTTPATKLHVSSGASATTTVSIGELGLTSSKACVNMNQANGNPGSFFIFNNALVVESGYCK